MEEENFKKNPKPAAGQAAKEQTAPPQTAFNEQNAAAWPPSPAPDLGKFKSVEALVHAYGELEAEFTRRSQRLKALEEAEEARSDQAQDSVIGEEALLRAVKENEGLRAQIIGEYLSSLKGVPLLGGTGALVTAPAVAPKTIKEAGALALGYLKKQNN